MICPLFPESSLKRLYFPSGMEGNISVSLGWFSANQKTPWHWECYHSVRKIKWQWTAEWFQWVIASHIYFCYCMYLCDPCCVINVSAIQSEDVGKTAEICKLHDTISKRFSVLNAAWIIVPSKFLDVLCFNYLNYYCPPLQW
jgi:hypothetical protein